MSEPPAFAAVDWGTSSFRLWMMDADGTVRAERRSDEGMTHAARAGFDTVLSRHMAALAAPADLPVVICGMAGARQGWLEAAYLTVPVDLGALVERAARVPCGGRDVRILPGMALRERGRPDVMRGEETQLLGARGTQLAAGAADGPGRQLHCLPGTHSKWVETCGDTVVTFRSFMTGDLFAAIAGHSILASAVAGAGGEDHDADAFAAAVREALEAPERLTAALFSIRGAELLFAAGADEARARLSGLLIGAELAGAGVRGRSAPTMLIASGRMERLYREAFAAAGLPVLAVDADRAVRHGLLRAARSLWPHALGSLPA